MALFISEQVAAVTAYNAGNPQFTVYYGENAAEAARQALLAQGYAVDAATSAAYAGGFQTPEYATRAAGEAATTVGQVFRVPLNTSPQTFAWYRRAAIDSDGSSLDLNFTTASFESYALSEEVSPIGAVDSGYLVKGNGLTTPVSASIIYDSGTNIGIGTTSPGYALDVVGDFRATTDIVGGAAITTGNGISTGDVIIELGGLRTGSGNCYIDLHATNGTDFESRLIRYPGANGGMDIINMGTGGLVISQEGAAPMVFKTTATERMRIDSSGNVGIGVTSPQAKLHTRPTTDVNFWVTNDTTTLRTIAINDAANDYINWRRDANQHTFETSGAERLRIKSGGQVRFVPRASAPSGAEAGDVYYDSSTNKLRCYNGSTWNDLF